MKDSSPARVFVQPPTSSRLRAALLFTLLIATAIGSALFIKIRETSALQKELAAAREQYEVAARVANERLAQYSTQANTLQTPPAQPPPAPANPQKIQVPEKIREAAQKLIPNLDINRYEQFLRDGAVVHLVRGKAADHDCEVTLNADGDALVAELPPALMPEAMRRIAVEQAKDLEVTRVHYELDPERGGMYRIEGKNPAGLYDFAFNSQNQLLKMRVPTEIVPQIIREAALRAVPGMDITYGRVYPNQPEVQYKLVGKAQQHEYEVVVSANGELQKMSMPVEALPQPIHKAMTNAMEGLKFTKGVEQDIRNNKGYESKGWIGENRYSVHVSADGKIVQVNAAPVEPPRFKPGKSRAGEAAPQEF